MSKQTELSYSPEDFDAIEGMAQDMIARGNPMENATQVVIALPSEDEEAKTVVLRGTEVDFFKKLDPTNIIKMVVVVRRLRYLFERANASSQQFAAQLQELMLKMASDAKTWDEEREQLLEALRAMAHETGKSVEGYLNPPEPEDGSTDSEPVTADTTTEN
jgi:hypothetical protein